MEPLEIFCTCAVPTRLCPPNQKLVCVACGCLGDRTSLSSFTASELTLSSLFSVSWVTHFPLPDNRSEQAPSPFHWKAFPTKQTGIMTVTTTRRLQKVQKFSTMGVELRVALWRPCLLGRWVSFAQNPFPCCLQTAALVSFKGTYVASGDVSQAWPICVLHHSPSLLHQGWTREPGTSALSTEIEKLPLLVRLEARGGCQLR